VNLPENLNLKMQVVLTYEHYQPSLVFTSTGIK